MQLDYNMKKVNHFLRLNDPDYESVQNIIIWSFYKQQQCFSWLKIEAGQNGIFCFQIVLFVVPKKTEIYWVNKFLNSL